MCMDTPATRKVLSRMIRSVLWASAATLPLLAATAAHAQQSLDGLKGNARMSAAQVRAVGTLSNLRVLRTDAAGIPSQIEADLGAMNRSDASFDADSQALLRDKARALLRALEGGAAASGAPADSRRMPK